MNPALTRGVAASLALAAGLMWVDTRPTWDETGITAMALAGAVGGTLLRR